jgi:hypothetical protein
MLLQGQDFFPWLFGSIPDGCAFLPALCTAKGGVQGVGNDMQGAFASRMSHSCTPNCQAVVMSCGGRLTIAVYTLRHVHAGEELTFDYASVTESEKEFRTAICLCGTRHCRGTFLMFAGSRAFQQASCPADATLSGSSMCNEAAGGQSPDV